MRNIQIFKENGLSLFVEIGMTSEPIKVIFFDKAKNKKAEGTLTIHHYEKLEGKTLCADVLNFTGTFLIEKTSCFCTGICYQNGPIEEVWLMLIENKEKVINTSCSRTEFIEKAKTHYQNKKIPFDESGNMQKPTIFSKSEVRFKMCVNSHGINEYGNIRFVLEMYQGIFPILDKIDYSPTIRFARWLDDYHIQIISEDEAGIHGILLI